MTQGVPRARGGRGSGGQRGQRPRRARGNRVYEKPALSTESLIERLDERGLVMLDRDRAARYLRHIGYFRLSPYLIPFRRRPRSADHLLREGTQFDDVLELYVFDRQLRLLVMDALERVEVAVRAALTDHMATTCRAPHWYVDGAHFRDAELHKALLRIIGGQLDDRLRRDAEHHDEDDDDADVVYRSALEHYAVTYSWPELPPSWLMVEMLTIGQLQKLYGNLARRQDRAAIARSLGLNDPLLGSWLRTYVRVRNICAHHGRLWNVGLGVYPRIPTGRGVAWLELESAQPASAERRLYPVLVSLQSVLETVSPRSSWVSRLHELLSQATPMVLRGMGVPDGWSEDPFWARHLD